jgi:hypothetical protein
MLKEVFYKVFLNIKRTNPDINIIFSGDFNQLLPVKDRLDDSRYAEKLVLSEICDNNKILLTKCRRSDDELFNLCHPDNINNVKKEMFNNKFTERRICFTHFKRININKTCMDNFINSAISKAKMNKKKVPEPLILKKVDYDPYSQDVKLLKGMPIIGKINIKKLNIYNNEIYTIDDIKDGKVYFKKSGQETNNVNVNDFQKIFRVGFCITTHSSQGNTFNHPYAIHEWNLFDHRMKYVALSRATKREFINII